jgi:hypothetical protein
MKDQLKTLYFVIAALMLSSIIGCTTITKNECLSDNAYRNTVLKELHPYVTRPKFKIRYPRKLEGSNIEDTIKVKLIVDGAGIYQGGEIIQPSKHARLNQAGMVSLNFLKYALKQVKLSEKSSCSGSEVKFVLPITFKDRGPSNSEGMKL